MNKKYLYLLAAGHLSNDINAGSLPALLPFFVNLYGMDYTAAAGLMFASSFLSSIIQPLFGWLAVGEFAVQDGIAFSFFQVVRHMNQFFIDAAGWTGACAQTADAGFFQLFEIMVFPIEKDVNGSRDFFDNPLYCVKVYRAGYKYAVRTGFCVFPAPF